MLLTKTDNVKIKRKRREMAQKRLAKLKFSLMQKLKAYKQEQMEIFAGVPIPKTVEIVPSINQAETSFMHKETK